MLGGKWGTLLTDGLWALAARDVDACTKAGFQELSWRFYILTRLAPAGPPQRPTAPLRQGCTPQRLAPRRAMTPLYNKTSPSAVHVMISRGRQKKHRTIL